MPDVTFTKVGYVWGEIVNEICWLQEEEGDLSEALMSIENQLGEEYWESEEEFTITVPEQVAERVTQVENVDTAEQAELDRKLNERDRQAALAAESSIVSKEGQS